MENKAVEKTSLLTAGSILISGGVAYLDKNYIVGLVLVVLGVGCIAWREFRKIA